LYYCILEYLFIYLPVYIFVCFSDVLIVILKSYESKISSALDHMQKKVPWKTEGFHYKFHSIVENIGEEEGTATSLLNIASVRKVSSPTKNSPALFIILLLIIAIDPFQRSPISPYN